MSLKPQEEVSPSPVDTMTAAEIRAMFKETLGNEISYATLRNYISKRRFPEHLGLGNPRIWRRSDVVAWFNDTVGEGTRTAS